jgi:DNA-binding XRE family transcriptional regulator
MDCLMKIDGAKLKTLREERSWSQDHLAGVAALSVRTIQRVEAEGVASSETRMALSAAFGIPPAELLITQAATSAKTPSKNKRIGLICGIVGVVVGAGGAVIGIATGANSPAEMGIEFGVLGAFLGLSGAVIGTITRQRLVGQASHQ